MNHEIDLKKYDIHTDLVLEVTENNNSVNKNISKYDDIIVTKISVDKSLSKTLNKKEGNYITIEFNDVTDENNRKKVTNIFTKELTKVIDSLNLKKDYKVLLIGLGNENSTPDSLGPKVSKNIQVTGHLFILNKEVQSNIRNVSSINPGVMAETGIETLDIVSSVVNRINPNLVIIVDALAAHSMSRINKSIQITDSGIHPGSGVGNKRKEISSDTLGVPTIAVGVPTVVESSIIVYDTIELLFKHISYIKDNSNINKLVFTRTNYYDKIKDKTLSNEEKKEVIGLLGELSDDDRISLINEVLNSLEYNFIVTPKEIDFQIDNLKEVLVNGINECLHKKV